jgi:hypothetical protein
MIISGKQQEANRRNAQRSSGPKTSDGKAAVRLNALKYGLRAQSTVLTWERPEDYMRLWDEMEADWRPQTRTEQCYLETIVTSQWLLQRVARSEAEIYERTEFGAERFVLLAYVAKQRAQLERSFRTAVADIQQSQKDRRSQPLPQTTQSAQAAKTAPTPRAEASAPPPAYVMSEGTEAQPVSCAPAATGTR